VIEIDHVTKRFDDGTVAVDDLTLTIPSGAVLALLGSSGSGKTTTLRMINRLIEPTSGEIRIDGRSVHEGDVRQLRRNIGYVIQQAGLFPHRTVLDNVTTVPRLLGWSKKKAAARAMEMLELVGLDPRLAKRYPAQLSGGQQQRVGVARALAADPNILLMDEPFGAVDPIVRTQLQAEFVRLQRELNKTVVFVTHDVDEAITVAGQVAMLREGGVLAQVGTPTELLTSPVDEFVADFLGENRLVRLLGLRPLDDLPLRPVDAEANGYRLTLEDGRAIEWRNGTGTAPAVPVFDGDTAKQVLEAALASPAGAVVRIDGRGAATGVISLDDLRLDGGGAPG
jgi:osmoprotectant transport system ATP-binding protein